MCDIERGTGTREIYPSLDQVNKERNKDSKGFSGRKQMISKKIFTEIARDFSPEIANQAVFPAVHRLSPKKTPIWASICNPVAPILLISSGHSPRLGGHSFRLGGHGPGMPPRGAGSATVCGAYQKLPIYVCSLVKSLL